MGRHTRVWHSVQASKAEALIAVDHYNTTGERRSFEAFVVHMHLAWLYLLHARLRRDGVDFRYWDDRAKRRRLMRVDGEPRTWELARCVVERWPDKNQPVRLNLEFFIGLRNKIEHRYEEGIGLAVAGHAQALVVNYEQELSSQFGQDESLASQLRFPIYLSSLTPSGIAAIKRLRASLPANVTRYIRDFQAAVTDDVAQDARYEFRVHLIPQLGPNAQADLAINFVKADDLTDAQRAALSDLASGFVASKVKHEPVQNMGLHKPLQATRLIAAKVGKFTMADFVWYWKHYKVRPAAGAPDPAATDQRYCVWDEPHGDYLYTDAWVRKIIKHVSETRSGAAATSKKLRDARTTDVLRAP